MLDRALSRMHTRIRMTSSPSREPEASEGRKLTRPSHRYSTISRPKVPTAAINWLSVRAEISRPTAISTAPSRKKARMVP